MDTQRGHQSLFFDPDGHQKAHIKAFTELSKQNPNVPRISLDAAIQPSKIEHADTDGTEPRLTVAQYHEICDNWRSKDRVAKFFEMFSSSRMHTDWQIAQPDESIRNSSTWDSFLKTMKEYYKRIEIQCTKPECAKDFLGCSNTAIENRTCCYRWHRTKISCCLI